MLDSMGRKEQIRLAKGMETLLVTLYAKALDAREERPLLADAHAAALVGRIDYDFRKFKLDLSDRLTVVVRSKHLDEWTSAFIAHHPNATLLHLGCGLDGRVVRVDPPATVHWFDVDYPEVIDLRRQFYPPRDGYEMIATSVTDEHWLDHLPADRPTMIVAEGLLPYLAKDEVKRLLERLTVHFTDGEMAFDVINSFAAWTWKARRWFVGVGGIAQFVMDDPRKISQWVPRLELVADVSMLYAILRSPAAARLSSAERAMYRIMGHVPALRNMMRLLRYRFW